MLYAQGLLSFLLPLSVLLFEPDVKSRRRMLPFLVLGRTTALYILWALTAYPLQVYIEGNSIVYINQATNNTAVALLYVIATCGSLFFSKVRAIVIFGAANLAILLVVMEFKRYAFTSLWCIRGSSKCDHPRLLLEKQRGSAFPLRGTSLSANLKLQTS